MNPDTGSRRPRNPDQNQGGRNSGGRNPDQNQGGRNPDNNSAPAPDTRTETRKKIDAQRKKVEAIAERAELPKLEKKKKKETKKKNAKGGKGKLKRMTTKEKWEPAKEESKFVLLEMAEEAPGKLLSIAGTLAYLGYKMPARLVEGSATLTDRLLNRVAKFGDSWMSKRIPGMKFMDKMLNKVEKRLKLDTLLVDIIKEDTEKREKLRKKLLDEEKKAIKKHKDKEKKRKAKEKKEKEWADRYGDEVMQILKGERTDIEDDLAKDDEKEDAGEGEQKAAA